MDYIQEEKMPSDLPNSTVTKDAYVPKIYWQYTNRRADDGVDNR